MSAYYNEIDPFAAQWLRNLIVAGHIAPGDVDERSIVDVRPDDLRGYKQCHFFAGIGGWSHALRMARWRDDTEVWTGSCPCQPFSLAGAQKGFDDSRHLWPEFRRLISECNPPVVFGEQVASAPEWLRLVRSDLEAMGYAVGAMPIQAASAGADHLRDRYWFVADADDEGPQGRRVLPERARERAAGPDGMAYAERVERTGQRVSTERGTSDPDAIRRDGSGLVPRHNGAMADPAGERSFPGSQAGIHCQQEGARSRHVEPERLDWVIGADGKARRVKPGIRLLAHGVPARVGKLRGFGNAIDPRPAAAFIEAYKSRLTTM